MSAAANGEQKNEQIIKHLESLTILEMGELVKEMEERWGVKADAVVAAPAAAADASSGEEQTEFSVVMVKADAAKKMAVIKVIRAATDLGLKEAKETAEGADKVIKEGLSKEAAEELKKQLAEAGAEVKLV